MFSKNKKRKSKAFIIKKIDRYWYMCEVLRIGKTHIEYLPMFSLDNRPDVASPWVLGVKHTSNINNTLKIINEEQMKEELSLAVERNVREIYNAENKVINSIGKEYVRERIVTIFGNSYSLYSYVSDRKGWADDVMHQTSMENLVESIVDTIYMKSALIKDGYYHRSWHNRVLKKALWMAIIFSPAILAATACLIIRMVGK